MAAPSRRFLKPELLYSRCGLTLSEAPVLDLRRQNLGVARVDEPPLRRAVGVGGPPACPLMMHPSRRAAVCVRRRVSVPAWGFAVVCVMQ
jgi:hypothetical protein